MATQADIRDFIAMVTSGFMPLRDLIVKGQQMGLNVQDTVEIVANLQPNLVPSNIMASMNAPAMVGDPYTAPRIGFDEAVTEYGVQEEPQTGIFQEMAELQFDDPVPDYYYNRDGTYDTGVGESSYEQQYRNPNLDAEPEYDYQAPPIDPVTAPVETLISNPNRRGPGVGSGSMSMSDVINNNLRESMGQVGEGQTPQTRFPPPMPSPRPAPPPPRPAPPGIRLPRVATDPFEIIDNKRELGRPPPVIPPVIDIEPQVSPRPPTPPVNFSYGDTQTGMMDAAATLRSPFTSGMDRQAAQDYMSGIVSNIRLPF